MAAAADGVRGLARHHPGGAAAGPAASSPTRSRRGPTSWSTPSAATPASRAALTASEELPPAVDQLRFFAGAARVLEGRSAGEYMAGHTSYVRREPIGVCAPGDAVELPADDGGLEVRAGPGRRQHRGAQAVRHHAGVHAAAGRDRGRVPAAGRAQRGLRRPGHRPRAGRAPDAAAGLDHRLDPGRHARWPRPPRPTSSAPTSSWAARRRSSSSTTPTSPRRPRRSRWPATSTPARTAPPPPGCWPARGVYDDFVAALTEQARGTRTGAPDDEDVALRPAEQRQPAGPGRPASSTGCPTTPRCRPAAPGSATRGYFYAPTVVAGLRQDDEIIQDEVFGPVITVQRFTDEDEAVRWANGVRVRAGLLGLDPRPRPGDAGLAAAGLRLRLGQHPHPAGRRDAARRLQALRLRQGPVHVRAGGLHPGQARHAQPREA